MSCGPRRLVAPCVAVAALSGMAGSATAQPFVAAQTSGQPAAAAALRSAGEFAPGVLTVIEPDVSIDDVIQLHDIVEIRSDEQLKWEPYSTTVSRTLYEMAEAAPFVQTAWCLELSTKPLRMIEVDIPQPDGEVRRHLVWYLVYRIRNTGAGLALEVPATDDGERAEVNPELDEEVATIQRLLTGQGQYSAVEQGVEPLRFIPEFVLMSQDRDEAGQPVRKAYLDRVVPAAIPAIERREMRGAKLHSSVEIAQQELSIEAGRAQQGVWGVATWVDVDPEIDFFSVYVGGLSNGYRWDDPPGAFELGSPAGAGRTFTRKTLQLNYWRPGDEYQENEREIRFGVPQGKADLYGVGEGVAYRWIYR